jgi:hypothetical protein
MAITQSRMLEVIRVANTFKTKILDYSRTMDEIIKDLPPDASPDQLWRFVRSMQMVAKSLTLSFEDLEILALEQAHFKLNATRNAREAKRQRLRRGKDPETITPRSTAPDSIQIKFSPKTTHLQREMEQTKNTNFSPKFAPTTNNSLIAGINEDLANQKLAINKLYESKNMRAPYPDFLDDSEQLAPDHLRALGLAPEGEDSELF